MKAQAQRNFAFEATKVFFATPPVRQIESGVHGVAERLAAAYTLRVVDTRALPLVESDLVKQERVNVLSYALLHVLSSVYKQPRMALRKIDALIVDKGPSAAFGLLSNNPAEFGELNPYCDDFFLPSPADADVRSFACYALHFRLEAMSAQPAPDNNE